MINSILSEVSPLYGFCSFEKLSNSLIDCRAKSRIPDNAKSIIVLLFPYFLGDEAYEGSDISKYAVVPDYHDVIIEILLEASEKLSKAYPDEKFVVFTDNSPIPEVRAAIDAGLGVRGLNGLFINKDFGSWVFIGEIVTTMELNFPENFETTCLGCEKCVSFCPTNAINKNGINSERCLSYITQKKGKLTDEQEELIRQSGCAWGCDICQNVCPMNKSVNVLPLDSFINGAEIKARTESDISDRAYAWRGEKVIKRNLAILHKEGKVL